MRGKVPRSSRILVTTVVAASLAVAAGCSSSSSGASGGSTSSGTPSAPASGSSTANASPITIMSWNSISSPVIALPETKTAVEARVKVLNAAGGINGHQVNLIFCDTAFSPNTEAACARKAVSDHVVAVVGAASYFPNTPAILAKAGIPLVGARGADPTEFTASTSFPLEGGNYSWATGDATLAASLHLKSVAIVSTNAPTSAQQNSIIAAKLKQLGVKLVRTVDAPIGAASQTATAASASAGTDGLIFDAVPSDAEKVLQSLTQANYKGDVISPSTDLTPSFLTALGTAYPFKYYAVGVVLPPTDTSNSAVAQFNQEMNAEDASMPKDEDALTFWTAMGLFAKVAANLPVINAKTVLAAMNAAKSVDLGGVVPPYSVAGVQSPVTSAPRLFNPYVVYDQVVKGDVSPVTGKFVDPFTIS